VWESLEEKTLGRTLRQNGICQNGVVDAVGVLCYRYHYDRLAIARLSK